MELSFNVPKAGPLSQIGVHILSFDVAVQLATGAYGWWKSRERTDTLIQSLSASHAALVSTSSFNVVSYRKCREIGLVQSLAVQEGVLRSIPGSVESTAVSDNPGSE